MEENKIQDEILVKVEELINKIKNDGINANNLEHLEKLEDIHYKIIKEKHMSKEEDNMRYYDNENYGTNFDNYGTRMRDGRGRYMDSGNYGRRGYDTKYRGDDMINAMSDEYGRYMENIQYGNYGSPETDKSFNYMIKEWKKFGMYIGEEAQEPQHKDMLRQAAEEVARNV